MTRDPSQPPIREIAATFDGRTFVPDEPVGDAVRPGTSVRVPVPEPAVEPTVPEVGPEEEPGLTRLIRLMSQFPDNPDWPIDGAAQHRHYAHGHPKEPENEVSPELIRETQERIRRIDEERARRAGE